MLVLVLLTLALPQDGGYERAVARFTAEEHLAGADAGRRAAAAALLGREFPETSIALLQERSLRDVSAEVRAAASAALAQTGDPAAPAAAIDALFGPSMLLRRHAAESLATIGDPAAIGPLVAALEVTARDAAAGRDAGPRAHATFGTRRAYVAGYGAQVASGAAIADPEIGTVSEGATIDVRVHAAGGGGAAVAAARMIDALEAITGERRTRSSRSWSRWWASVRREHPDAVDGAGERQ